MPPIFTMEQRDALKVRLLEIGTELIASFGIKKMSISKVTAKAGIAKGTFYNFFESKERFVIEIIHYRKEEIYRCINKIVEENGFLDKQGLQILLSKFSFSGKNNVLSIFSKEDMLWLRENCKEEYILDSIKEDMIMKQLFAHVKGLNPRINFHVVANYMKAIALLNEHKSEMHQDALDETQQLMVQAMFDYMFREEER